MKLDSAANLLPECPPAILGVHTDVQDVEGGVVLDVTGNDEAANQEIRARTDVLVALAAKDAGAGDGPGLGRCPVVLHDARVSATPIDLGMRIFVSTLADEVDWLRAETRVRLFELRAPESARGRGEDTCPSALPSAMTEVGDADGGVVVTISSRDPDVAEEIRGRAWEASERALGRGPRASSDATAVALGLPLCPVITASTRVTWRATPRGAEIVVRAAPGMVDVIRRETRARARAFH